MTITDENIIHCVTLPRFLELEPGFVFDPTATFERWTEEVHCIVIDGNQIGTDLPSRAEYVAKLSQYILADTELEQQKGQDD
ncbi:hypothetical protein [Pseudanabaena sp. FACHB-2040]|uniref:hypothetical protein n=1 Tax=Pseudanabaena sp. FACHB-2040 TaxID=2692859 RepID=UPI001686200F|nr:hypothetical protein [Pseudanabaena sp. FACHB-2040]MBD2256640.1 hypothetical protein [Pseudanabaena sp. FACHB-2040]